MEIFTALVKIIIYLENYYNKKIAGLGENFIPQKFWLYGIMGSIGLDLFVLINNANLSI